MVISYYTLNKYSETGNKKEKLTSLGSEAYQTFLNLTESKEGPLISTGIYPIYTQVDNLEKTSLPIQVHPAANFREKLIQRLGISGYEVEDPNKLPKDLRTKEWEQLISWIENFDSYCKEKKYRIIALLNRMGFYNISLKLIPNFSNEEIKTDFFLARLASKKAMALYKTKKTKDNTLLKILAHTNYKENYIQFGAAISLLVDYAKKRDMSQVKFWADLAKEEYKKIKIDNDPIAILQSSIFYRAYAYLPFLSEDQSTVGKYMHKALMYAEKFYLNSPEYELIAKENLHPIYETNIKIAMWRNDLQDANFYAKKLTELDPYDPKVYLHLGDTYRVLNRLDDAILTYMKCFNIGHPFSAYSSFLIGHCFERLGDFSNACEWYVTSLEYEPYSISALEKLKICSQKENINYLSEFADKRLLEIDKLKKKVLQGEYKHESKLS
ncbi:hypothetical protein COC43_23145 [Bacillus thuringiensis]|uniref:tetratricopeptide repeat protein n=1 Tax=Bacillus thuringiensis TaxID=1428 RepID=UPI000BFE31E6|nr:hypothetical protein [Bacillus thuringiensis]PGR73107.1 hypothetical protein COC43_23145 [Bacillus thuringiensis]